MRHWCASTVARCINPCYTTPMMKRKGKFIIVDGIDGSGKGTIVDAYMAWAQAKQLHVFDVRAFAKSNQRLPEPKEWQGSDVLFSAEPTHAGIGHVIREEIVRENARHYSGLETAMAFSLTGTSCTRRSSYRRLHEAFSSSRSAAFLHPLRTSHCREV